MDWNVFFSTISQTSGAIVGIFSAFLITKIVSNQAEFAQDQNDTSRFIFKSEALCDEAKSRYFKWYNERIRDRELDDIDEAFHENDELLTPNEYIETFRFSPFDVKSDLVSVLENKISEFEKERAEQAKYESCSFGTAILMPKSMHVRSLSNFVADTTSEREAIDDLLVKTIHHIKTNKAHLSKLNVGADSSSLINFSIVAVLLLFFAGVIYPLSFLPLSVGSEIKLSLSAFWGILFSLKGAMLSLISIIFSGLMLVFLRANIRLRHSQESIEKLQKYSQLENYSNYYKNYVESTGTSGEEFI